MTWNRPPIAPKKRTDEAVAAAKAAQNSHGEPRERR